MNGRLVGATIASLVVVAVAATSLRLISFSFREQPSPERTQAIQDRQGGDETSRTLADGVQAHAEREFAERERQLQREAEQRLAEFRRQQEQAADIGHRPEEERRLAEARRQAEQERQQREAEQRQAEVKLLQDQVDAKLRHEEGRKLAEARRQAEQQRQRDAKQREAELARKFEEQRRQAEVWLEEQERRRRSVEQPVADLKRLQEDERRLGLRQLAEAQRQQAEVQPAKEMAESVRKGGEKIDASAARSASQSPPEGSKAGGHDAASPQRSLATTGRASRKTEKDVLCMLFSQPAPNAKPADAPPAGSKSPRASPAKSKSAARPPLRGTTTAISERASRVTWQVQAFNQSFSQ